MGLLQATAREPGLTLQRLNCQGSEEELVAAGDGLPPCMRVCGKLDVLDQILCRLFGHHKVIYPFLAHKPLTLLNLKDRTWGMCGLAREICLGINCQDCKAQLLCLARQVENLALLLARMHASFAGPHILHYDAGSGCDRGVPGLAGVEVCADGRLIPHRRPRETGARVQ